MQTLKKTIVVTLLCAALAPADALRADEGSVSLAPAVVMLRGETGQSATQRLSFSNDTQHPFSFDMVAQDIVVRDGKRVFVEAGTLPGSIAATAVYSQKQFTVAAGASVSMDVTVTIPPRPASRAVAILCRGTTTFGSGPVRSTASIGTLLTFSIAGGVNAAEASSLIVQPPTASSSFAAAQQVTNSGTEPVIATGMLVILDAAGVLVGRQAIPAWRMLPGETIDVRVEYGGDLLSGHYRAMITYDLAEKALTSSAEFDVT